MQALQTALNAGMHVPAAEIETGTFAIEFLTDLGDQHPIIAIGQQLADALGRVSGEIDEISRQLAADNAALAAYINLRMTYGVNLRVENQLINGNGTSPNVSGMMKSGNYTAHGYSASALGAGATRLDLIRKVIADCMLADYPASAVILNPADWAEIDAAFEKNADPLTGKYPPTAEYENLFSLIVQRAPAPIGLG